MKNDVLFLCLGLLLASCQPNPTLQPTSMPMSSNPTNTPPPTFTPIPTRTPTPTFTLTPPTFTSTPSPSPEPTLSTDTNEKNDYLVYVVNEIKPSISSKPQLMLYDPATNETHVLFTNWVNNSFSLSKDNRLAVEKDDNIYVWDYPFEENTLTKIIFHGSPTTKKAVLSWSLDGRYLLLTGVQEGGNKLFVWDGKNIFDIYNYQGVIFSYGTTWSDNDELAFTERFTDYISDWGDIYVWDRKNIVKVSQNPSAFPAWSNDGQLAFLSYQNRAYTISVWDGKSTNNGAPDIKTLAVPDIEVTVNSYPAWTNAGSIVFTGRSKTGNHQEEVYEWDGQTTRNISQTPSIDLFALTWRNDGYWSAVTDLGRIVIVRDNINRTVLETKGSYSKWTQSGLLVFCNYKDNHHMLSIWNSKGVVDVAHGDYVYSMWTNSNGKFITCTYG